jgi:polyferredoxin/formate hydrogenlyase subunit 6/NADH:ubiquinone oxidoreductase subunit I
MKIRTTRRISQVFFILLFLWFCAVTTLGDAWWQLRGWPVNWFLELDPLVGLTTLLTTGTLYAGLLWGVATIALTVLLGRFFCGWICPFGTLHQAVGWLGRRRKPLAEQARVNRPSRWQVVKYWILTFLLAAAAADLLKSLGAPLQSAPYFIGTLAALAIVAALAQTIVPQPARRWMTAFVTLAGLWSAAAFFAADSQWLSASLQIGLLDPLPLLHRSVNLALLPLVDESAVGLTGSNRFYTGAWLIGFVFLTAVWLNLKIPRFYCRFICPLGALFALAARNALWRIGKKEADCIDCVICEKNCEGACAPASVVRVHECVLCLNCRQECRHGLIVYGTGRSAAGEIDTPELSRRQFVVSTLSGLAAVPMLHLNGQLSTNWDPQRVRPPGSLPESQFLDRCLKCGQCMRICPTNVIHPAGLEGGLEGLWTPVLNFRIGTSGCQYKCIACGNICPTAAIRPITLDERLGQNRYEGTGPIRIGMAFVDRGRCLPWAMDIPCIVCQENCPVSPKAIVTRTVFSTVATNGPLIVAEADFQKIRFRSEHLIPGRLATGDYYCREAERNGSAPLRIVGNLAGELTVTAASSSARPLQAGSRIEILIRLQQPYVRPEQCIGCGVCEHECPVRGQRAIRVTAENESRHPEHAMILEA